MLRLLAILGATLLMSLALAQKSPEVHTDRTVTFRLKMPNALKVDLSLEGFDGMPMSKSNDGWWSVTTKALPADIYGYTFNVDGTTVLDPQNHLFKPNLIWQSNMVVVPGNELWEVQDVPHGALHRHHYKSGVIGDQRDFFVYTPPAYSTGKNLPVLYLLHGFSDTADGWTAVGKAHVILDNLIAQGKAKPMLVVMTLGYGVPDFASPGGTNFRNPELVTRNYTNFSRALLEEVEPMVEKEYKVSKAAKDRAIAGLSMGGAESLFVGLNNLGTFGYIGAFSSGGLPGSPESAFPKFTADAANKHLKLLWIACGTEDGLIGMNRGLDKWLTEKRANHSYVELPGRHTWMVWRRNLAEFASLIFKS
ncbi:MAG: esterase [Fimbriimonas sp.]